jgi:hypothetical protein
MRDVGSGGEGAISLTTRANNSCSILNKEINLKRLNVDESRSDLAVKHERELELSSTLVLD